VKKSGKINTKKEMNEPAQQKSRKNSVKSIKII
jgi:hypothetical protein